MGLKSSVSRLASVGFYPEISASMSVLKHDELPHAAAATEQTLLPAASLPFQPSLCLCLPVWL